MFNLKIKKMKKIVCFAVLVFFVSSLFGQRFKTEKITITDTKEVKSVQRIFVNLNDKGVGTVTNLVTHETTLAIRNKKGEIIMFNPGIILPNSYILQQTIWCSCCGWSGSPRVPRYTCPMCGADCWPNYMYGECCFYSYQAM